MQAAIPIILALSLGQYGPWVGVGLQGPSGKASTYSSVEWDTCGSYASGAAVARGPVVTVTRTGTETAMCEAAPVTAAANALPVTEQGAQIFAAFTQYATAPEDATAWTGVAAVDADVWTWVGGATGDRLTDSSGASSQGRTFTASIPNPAAGVVTASCWAAPDSLTTARLSISVGGSTGTVVCASTTVNGGRISCNTTVGAGASSMSASIFPGSNAAATGSVFVAGCNLTNTAELKPYRATASTSTAPVVSSVAPSKFMRSYPWTVVVRGTRTGSTWYPTSGTRALWSVNGSGANSLSTVLTSAGLTFSVTDADSAVTKVDYATAISEGTHWVASVYESPTVLRLYLDGVEVGDLTTAGTGLAAFGTAALKIGARDAGEEFNGWISGVSVCKGSHPNGCKDEFALFRDLEVGERMASADINHFLFYGQSLAVGAAGQPALSTSVPANGNLTFAAGPKSTLLGSIGWNPGLTSLVPLVEDNATSDYPSGTRGETVCSGAANYATELGTPGVILASTAGHGGYSISQLGKMSPYKNHDGDGGTPDDSANWYQLLVDQVTAGKALATAQGKSYAVSTIGWLQGEADGGGSQSYYRSALLQMRADLDAAVQAITGQTQRPHLIVYQTSPYGAASGDNAARLALLELAQQDRRIHLASPLYHLPAAADGTHLNNVGYLWLGHYFGRAYASLASGQRPRWINPRSATLTGASEVTISFDVPTPPLVLDDVSLLPATDKGFKVSDGSGTVAITDVSVTSTTVVLSLGRAVSGAATVRYALDYAGTGLGYTNGASGNLRDSGTETFVQGETTYPLWSVAPHFSLAVQQ